MQIYSRSINYKKNRAFMARGACECRIFVFNLYHRVENLSLSFETAFPNLLSFLLKPLEQFLPPVKAAFRIPSYELPGIQHLLDQAIYRFNLKYPQK
jgi:hypothetical protein